MATCVEFKTIVNGQQAAWSPGHYNKEGPVIIDVLPFCFPQQPLWNHLLNYYKENKALMEGE